MVIAWENLKRFLWCWLFLYFYLTKGFTLIAFRRHLSPFFLHPFYTFSSAHCRVICDTFFLTFLCFSVTILPQALRFWAGVFLPMRVFYLELFSHILERFCNSDAGGNSPSRILLCAYPHRVVPSSWRMVLNYSYCRYKTIGLSIAPVSHEV